jgi:hypothetical protein
MYHKHVDCQMTAIHQKHSRVASYLIYMESQTLIPDPPPVIIHVALEPVIPARWAHLHPIEAQRRMDQSAYDKA